MRVLKRSHVNKRGSAKRFKRHVRHTKAPNLNAPQRGGYRF